MIRVKLAGLFLAMALLVSGALGSGMIASAQDGTPEATSAAFPVEIMFLNAMTNVDNIDVYINGADSDQRVAENLPYGTFSDAFQGTSPATEVVVKQNRNNRFDAYLFNVILPTEAGNTYVVVISDFILIPIQMNTSAVAANSDVVDPARARFVQGSSQSPSLDVLLNDEMVLQDIGYGQAGEGGVLATGPTYTVTLNQTGTSTTALSQDVTLEADSSYIFVLIGDPGSEETPLTLVSTSLPFSAS